MSHARCLMLLMLIALTPIAYAQQEQQTKCILGRVPVEPVVTGKSMGASGGCGMIGGYFQSLLQIHNWGISYTPEYYLLEVETVCPAEFAVAYTRSNRAPVIYYRPSVKPDFFKDIAPATFQHYLNVKRHSTSIPYNVTWPCHRVPVQTVHVWRQRKLFVKLVELAVTEMTSSRSVDCADPRIYGQPGDRFTWDRVREKIAVDRIYTAAITFLHGVAYSNYFCA